MRKCFDNVQVIFFLNSAYLRLYVVDYVGEYYDSSIARLSN